MARIVALAHSARNLRQDDLLRAVLVCGCALALILAKDSLPF
ncbi:hypothetical protein [Novosphingobium lindaniclasticum]|jgi:hypothetical protein|nr:hypothetical protein [Novosphingobium lindaniclasticum]